MVKRFLLCCGALLLAATAFAALSKDETKRLNEASAVP